MPCWPPRFTRLGLGLVTATTMTVNTGSRRVLARCGLRHVRTEYGRYPDTILGAEHGDVDYEITRADWFRTR